MNTRTLSTLLGFLILSSTIWGQWEYGVKGGLGVSKITNEIEELSINPKTYFVVSGQIGVYSLIQSTSNLYFGAELLINQIEGKERSLMKFYDNNDIYTGFSKMEYQTHLTYLSLPVYVGINLSKFTLNAGFQLGLSVLSSEQVKGIINLEGIEMTFDETNHHLNFDKYDFGPRVGITFSIDERLSLEGTYYRGINNLVKDNPESFSTAVQQAIVGVRYQL